MATLKTFVIFLWILHYHEELVASQMREAFFRTTDDTYIYCEDFVNEPGDCSPAPAPKSFVFPDVDDEELNGATAHNCVGGFYSYHLFDSTPSQIYRLSLPVGTSPSIAPILDTSANIEGISSFEICCDRVFFVVDADIYVQNLQDISGTRITKRLFQAHDDIQKIQLCCNPDSYTIFYSIDGDGVYSLTMDGLTSTQIADYGSTTVHAFDVNCVLNHMAFGAGDTVYVWNYIDEPAGNIPIDTFTHLPAWETRTGETVVDLSLATFANEPNVLTAWTGGSGAGYALTFSTDISTSDPITGPLFNRAFADVLLCLDSRDCSQGCPVGTLCPCGGSSNYQSCCSGLCVPINGPAKEDFACFCSNEDTFSMDMCTASDSLPAASTDCPLDLIGAVKCQGGSRTSSSSIYAISAFSFTSICATDVRGKEQPLPPGTLPLMAHDMFSSAYLFKGQTNWNNFHGDRYGLYNVVTTTPGLGESGQDIYSIPVIVQERSDEIIGEYITISANENDEVLIRVRVPRYCNTRQIRWRKNGKFLKNYNGKVAITFDSVTTSDEGIYEIYFQGRIKRNWRRIVRVIVRSDSCPVTCITNGGVCSYSGSYCVCPPGRIGPICDNECPKGDFGLRSTCDFNCQEVFGDECSDCQNVLFCLEDPFGCQCYPGYEQPNCTPCRTGFYGLNCEGECSCSDTEVCDPYDGTCT